MGFTKLKLLWKVIEDKVKRWTYVKMFWFMKTKIILVLFKLHMKISNYNSKYLWYILTQDVRFNISYKIWWHRTIFLSLDIKRFVGIEIKLKNHNGMADGWVTELYVLKCINMCYTWCFCVHISRATWLLPSVCHWE